MHDPDQPPTNQGTLPHDAASEHGVSTATASTPETAPRVSRSEQTHVPDRAIHRGDAEGPVTAAAAAGGVWRQTRGGDGDGERLPMDGNGMQGFRLWAGELHVSR